MRRPLLLVAVVATAMVGVLVGASATAFATPLPEQTTAMTDVKPLVVPKNYLPKKFSAGTKLGDGSVATVGGDNVEVLSGSSVPGSSAGAPGTSGTDDGGSGDAVPSSTSIPGTRASGTQPDGGSTTPTHKTTQHNSSKAPKAPKPSKAGKSTKVPKVPKAPKPSKPEKSPKPPKEPKPPKP